jgi:transposase-like protein
LLVNKFGPLIAANLRCRRSRPTGRWHLDEMVVKIGGRRMYPWRAVDGEGEVLDVLVQKRRNKQAAIKLLRKLLKNLSIHPETITTDKLASYGAAAKVLGLPAATDREECMKTTAWKTPTWSFDDANENSKSSSRRGQLTDSSLLTQPSRTPSISNGI